ncbi:hypothetical protein CH372_19070 [Leptospira meyeri]|uniref:hypothetical protein n=2 Tax=Leptospira meyeri TaxID=29508 RepID=UPI000C296B88|nr:hypothetical protein [Leptospira meyeri]PKA10496.1 hypothetical protein CH372_19070 [Leptospira meyeri]TGM68653.1 hypothetical protein EHQ93_00030 [Leptospira meyeri]
MNKIDFYSKQEFLIKLLLITIPFFITLLIIIWEMTEMKIADAEDVFIYLPGTYCIYINSNDEQRMCKECLYDCPISFNNITFQNYKGKFIPRKVLKINKTGNYNFKKYLEKETTFYTSKFLRLYTLIGFAIIFFIIINIFTKANLGLF